MIAMPKRIGGKDDEEGPGVTVIDIKAKPPKMPKRIGGPDDEPDGAEAPMDGSAVKTKAASEALAAISDNDSGRFAKALEAFCRAVDSEPHGEGAHGTETESE
ncbi:MAG TPA: hypothetical protein VGA61_09120 [Anaerolineae bacterium]